MVDGKNRLGKRRARGVLTEMRFIRGQEVSGRRRKEWRNRGEKLLDA